MKAIFNVLLSPEVFVPRLSASECLAPAARNKPSTRFSQNTCQWQYVITEQEEVGWMIVCRYLTVIAAGTLLSSLRSFVLLVNEWKEAVYSVSPLVFCLNCLFSCSFRNDACKETAISWEKCSYKGKIEEFKKHWKKKHEAGHFRCMIKGCPQKPLFFTKYELEWSVFLIGPVVNQLFLSKKLFLGLEFIFF